MADDLAAREGVGVRVFLDEIETAAREASAGPWSAVPGAVRQDHGERITIVGCSDDADARHIAAANPVSVLAIIDALRDAESALEELPGNLAAATRQRMHDAVDFGAAS